MNQHPDFLLNQIHGPQDVKQLDLAQMKQLASEIRTLILEKDAVLGGHLGPDLGIVEATIAYHYVFNAPKDKMVWDVSHQTYPHKMLTGRALAWLDPEHYEDVTPYSNPDESPYDYYAVGHTSTSIALATGMARARDLMGGKENIMALIGDGSMTGGLAYEGLNNAAIEKHNLVVVVNDNQMSIDDNVGGLVTALKKLRDSNGQTPENPFTAMGFDYRYVADGNDIEDMIAAFEAVKDVDHPILLHINTLKGKGYEPAIKDEANHHWVLPFDLKTDKTTVPAPDGPTAASVALDEVIKRIKNDEKVLAINAAIPGSFGLDKIKQNYPENYVDVGIAEQESVAFAAGAVKEGAVPVLFESSTFLQRAFDQLSHDVAANDLPVVMLVAGGGISSNSKTHLGIFDQVMVGNLPNWIYLAPTTLNEEKAMLNWAINQRKHPVAIKIPTKPVPMGEEVSADFDKIKYQVKPGKDVAILALGDFYTLGQEVAEKLNATLINPVSANILDKDSLDKLAKEHELIVTLEDNSLDGGFGQKVASYLGTNKVLNFGQRCEYTDQVPLKQIYQDNHLTSEQIIADIKVNLND
ncbi:1-deoxy-D-xylulose-5-phosphate synthase [Lactobacillus jensenii]|jgi:1-deoxy-d-xylulose-5-phosphate synthase 2|uniref:1-deoxy-D-xylulose-5-phosphate synthase n=1 Tax=Lactobacillus jensenii TaxID=109790 RepID=A0A5N1I4Y6_LACJE|nr:1-deoxy-D-xylulose-5-phosphate synthase [Lactobacillus jensenii]EEQ69077.1 putative 1-deoxy-D-xylulose-5-phosphate synthase [Lactobacillus jensenii 1153]ERJ43539.1 1-deoxy-D-xylulose-5-phosphate synthase [Lactobacillus jensenii MD IIE-70(2)]APT14832.1 1-deoxy-D-xylulose-5-phosphate synthase [Lactobacillus jensenii]EEQ24522.1 putative 1-deoxy-D-xylulose-5-phosphate synthase [Lactobacillus jensenii 269-3]EEX27545.1 putative 1-deoxy-D-xylulose-5-phosphate synthase [Lactobacillus jensenii SJ-7A